MEPPCDVGMKMCSNVSGRITKMAQWGTMGLRTFFNNFSSQSKGVAILFNNKFEFKVHKVITDETYEGMKLILDITIEDKRMLLVNIYGPNTDDPFFIYRLLQIYMKLWPDVQLLYLETLIQY